jgi:hypothetical protein
MKINAPEWVDKSKIGRYFGKEGMIWVSDIDGAPKNPEEL